MDYSNLSLGSTYPKRARQLVKNQRAEWICDDTIRMKLPFMEGNLMSVETIEQSADSSTNVEFDGVPDTKTLDDNTILELAKRRLAIKKNLSYQFFDYMLILFCFAYVTVTWDYGSFVLIFILFSLFWGIRLLYRIFKFVKPSLKEGIVEYIKKRNDYRLESEFNRLKKEYMSKL